MLGWCAVKKCCIYAYQQHYGMFFSMGRRVSGKTRGDYDVQQYCIHEMAM